METQSRNQLKTLFAEQVTDFSPSEVMVTVLQKRAKRTDLHRKGSFPLLTATWKQLKLKKVVQKAEKSQSCST